MVTGQNLFIINDIIKIIYNPNHDFYYYSKKETLISFHLQGSDQETLYKLDKNKIIFSNAHKHVLFMCITRIYRNSCYHIKRSETSGVDPGKI